MHSLCTVLHTLTAYLQISDALLLSALGGSSVYVVSQSFSLSLMASIVILQYKNFNKAAYPVNWSHFELNISTTCSTSVSRQFMQDWVSTLKLMRPRCFSSFVCALAQILTKEPPCLALSNEFVCSDSMYVALRTEFMTRTTPTIWSTHSQLAPIVWDPVYRADLR